MDQKKNNNTHLGDHFLHFTKTWRLKSKMYRKQKTNNLQQGEPRSLPINVPSRSHVTWLSRLKRCVRTE